MVDLSPPASKLLLHALCECAEKARQRLTGAVGELQYGNLRRAHGGILALRRQQFPDRRVPTACLYEASRIVAEIKPLNLFRRRKLVV